MPKKQRLDYTQLEEGLRRYLIRSGPSSAKQACRELGISQPTFSRLLQRLKKQILQAGRGQLTRYALQGLLPDGRSEVVVYTIDEGGTTQHAATLHGIQPKGYYLASQTALISSNFYETLPYLFEDLRPSGFLGRLIPRLYPDLSLPDNVQNWTDNHCLQYLSQYGWDLIGNYIIGERAFEEYLGNTLNPPDVVPERDRNKSYPRLADLVMSAGIPGSSAAGEHPKFLAFKKDQRGLIPVLVKFSPPMGDAIGARVADLLVCEYIAHGILRSYGQIPATSCLLSGGNRLFLEMERFDRTNKGRKGLLSLRALDLQFVGKLNSWSETAEILFSLKKIGEETLTKIRWLETFGRLIGNTDMHHGNISLFTEGEKVLGLAPVYDMLPMLYAPQQNQLIERSFDPPLPKPSESALWKEAFAAALDFWNRVQADPKISTDFRNRGKENARKILKLSELGKKLPTS